MNGAQSEHKQQKPKNSKKKKRKLAKESVEDDEDRIPELVAVPKKISGKIPISLKYM